MANIFPCCKMIVWATSQITCRTAFSCIVRLLPQLYYASKRDPLSENVSIQQQIPPRKSHLDREVIISGKKDMKF